MKEWTSVEEEGEGKEELSAATPVWEGAFSESAGMAQEDGKVKKKSVCVCVCVCVWTSRDVSNKKHGNS
jgi:hypothetical protein